ncbi:hypothetical protein SAMN04487762_0389 [Polaribacter sp. Hel1_33_78]|jgi:hypothetical protein|uniref:DUF3575 domain-containing protein n=1 Tax=unclassified Polaribacter TaxID=196858 RepID=UPI00087DCBA3|nr:MULTISPECIES: DUF3575 domain-containing protein [unclassified Polaribacter]MBT3742032.1 DUF3575 domain-containing protein [Polaribacter sp.]MBT4414155.1 DUF3575 domain-containing protein [Polaribacter sp.]MBT7816196.1 DUF3575 domain-containing protein [Polaribacter sp.]MDG1196371.1 DUF3575 domain-containing protein [Polaribacter sp.]MDG1402515.1 DUF3575 domain-containing protein [Polaribacter sp.]
MKKITFLILLFVSTISLSQENKDRFPQDNNKHHELKLNAFSLIALSSFNVSYEYLINNDSSFGVDLFLTVNMNENSEFPKKFSLTPYYRWFFSEKFAARGFFVEAFGMLNTRKNRDNDGYYDSNGTYVYNSNNTNVTDFALGISVGGKFITRKNFVAEVYLGIGRNLLNEKTNIFETNIISRGGISLGYRF